VFETAPGVARLYRSDLTTHRQCRRVEEALGDLLLCGKELIVVKACVCKQTSRSVGACGVPRVVYVCCNVLTH